MFSRFDETQAMCGALVSLALAFALMTPVAAAPDEEQLGSSAGYPIGTARTWFYDEGVRVGSFSHLELICPHNRLAQPLSPRELLVAAGPPQLEYQFDGRVNTIDDFLARQRIMGLLVIKDETILTERYQYDRLPTHRFVSHSMAKSITSIAVGLALAEGRIASIEDMVAKYVPKLTGNTYGDTSIRNLLRMSSGVAFSEVYDGRDDLQKFGEIRSHQGLIIAVRAFDHREVEQGSRFHYATIETIILGAVLQAATGSTLSAYLTSRLWQPMGAEADATWCKGSIDGIETAGGSFNAVLRDYGRLGMLLANDGALGGHQIIPKDYLIEATDWHRHPEAFAPRRATPYFGYGYQFWIFPGEKRRFALLGVYGQSIFVDPELKLVLVITAAARSASVGKESLARDRDALWRGLVARYGKW
jgi:CubicO group peptidase (beta-lactamase class C family)